MATRSRIGMIYPDGTIKSIYCHWNGYPEYNGEILQKHYTDKEKIEKLLALGNISVLNPRLEPLAGEQHSFEKPCEDVTVAYERDRGETGEEAIESKRLKDFIDLVEETWGEFAYLFKDETWCYLKYNAQERKWKAHSLLEE